MSVPVVPDAAEARRWARDELSQEVYAAAEPGLLDRALRWLAERLDDLPVPEGGTPWATALLLLLVVVLIVLGLRLAGPLRASGSRQDDGELFGSRRMSAAEHRAAADRHAASGQWEDAVRERFRALVRGLEERALVMTTPGRTADEVAREAGARLPDAADRLVAAARVFDDVQYGGRPAGAEQDALLRRLDDDLDRARPVLDPVGTS